jgi:hypothetical protein
VKDTRKDCLLGLIDAEILRGKSRGRYDCGDWKCYENHSISSRKAASDAAPSASISGTDFSNALPERCYF